MSLPQGFDLVGNDYNAPLPTLQCTRQMDQACTAGDTLGRHLARLLLGYPQALPSQPYRYRRNIIIINLTLFNSLGQEGKKVGEIVLLPLILGWDLD